MSYGHLGLLLSLQNFINKILLDTFWKYISSLRILLNICNFFEDKSYIYEAWGLISSTLNTHVIMNNEEKAVYFFDLSFHMNTLHFEGNNSIWAYRYKLYRAEYVIWW